ncbi:NYN domain-containing protein [Asaccharospora irregularis]|uniref:Uncharacterized conserved protein, LabA/DUF88 family n=1 Tax=Asaccharospora irregularis DSM 2635 TaxID=1121321 RepID=A0A1M5JHP7_9FIRM|nr:NYN domain-containing protein [Asaccharospora irregularis]SHG40126.1 Uncharacterized conserved protein, LabA/DUF88 family [Asaccharospora irregularis DSM 2635]
MEEKRFALLIDADNISVKYVKYILDEISQYGVATYKRIYGDWTETTSSSWKDALLENSINPVQQFSYTRGKNSTDSAMIIDAMDILYTKSVEGFCIVSSDSDFTKLASRLREDGMLVIGMGEEKTPKPFRVACDRFISLNLLMDSDIGEEGISPKELGLSNCNKEEKNNNLSVGTIITKETIEEEIIKIISSKENGVVGLGEIGSTLLKKYPDFDVRNYGYSLLSKFLVELPRLKMIKRGKSISVERNDNRINKNEIDTYTINIVKSQGRDGIFLGELGNRIHNKYKNFNVRDYGYSKFSKYIEEIDCLSIKQDSNRQKKVFIKGPEK